MRMLHHPGMHTPHYVFSLISSASFPSPESPLLVFHILNSGTPVLRQFIHGSIRTQKDNVRRFMDQSINQSVNRGANHLSTDGGRVHLERGSRTLWCSSFCFSRGCENNIYTAADIHWLNSLAGQACLLVDSYRDLADGRAIAEVVGMIQVQMSM